MENQHADSMNTDIVNNSTFASHTKPINRWFVKTIPKLVSSLRRELQTKTINDVESTTLSSMQASLPLLSLKRAFLPALSLIFSLR
jgi:hypothetical protein